MDWDICIILKVVKSCKATWTFTEANLAMTTCNGSKVVVTVQTHDQIPCHFLSLV